MAGLEIDRLLVLCFARKSPAVSTAVGWYLKWGHLWDCRPTESRPTVSQTERSLRWESDEFMSDEAICKTQKRSGRKHDPRIRSYSFILTELWTGFLVIHKMRCSDSRLLSGRRPYENIRRIRSDLYSEKFRWISRRFPSSLKLWISLNQLRYTVGLHVACLCNIV